MKSTEIAGIPDSQQPVRDAEAPGLRWWLFFQPIRPKHWPREKDNERYAYLYGFESYWVAFEHSAYQLCRLFPRSDTSIIRFVTYPFPVVMASITDTELCAYSRRHILKAAEPDRRVLTAEKLSFEHYREWHRTEVEELT